MKYILFIFCLVVSVQGQILSARTAVFKAFNPTNTASYTRDGLVGEWLFDEGSGTTASDTSGNGNDGTISGATWVAQGSGYALDFDGVDDYVEAGTGLTLTTGATVLVGVYPRSLPSHTAYVAYRGSTASSSSFLLFELNGTDLSFDLNEGGAQTRFSTGVNSTLNQWNHVAAVYDGDSVSVYVNSSLIYGPSATSVALLNASASPLTFGKDSRASQYYLNGIIKYVLIYNRGLTSAEIQEIHNYFN